MFRCVLGLLAATLLAPACGGVEDPGSPAMNEESTREIACTAGPAAKIGLDFTYGRVVIEEKIAGPSGSTLRIKRYEKVGYDRATVLFLNGRTEFIEKYDPLFTRLQTEPWITTKAQTLADLPITFVTMDHEGQGLSSGLKGHISSYDEYVEGVQAVVQRLKKVGKPNRPLYLMAHSMGGLIAARHAQKYPAAVAGLILGSPMFGINPPAGATTEQLRQLAAGFALPAPYGFGFADRCALAPEAPVPVLGALATCLSTPACKACFADPAQPGCDQIPVDWAALGKAWGFFTSAASVGCKNAHTPIPSCTFPGPDFMGTTSNYEYCVWADGHPLVGPNPTFGWLQESFTAIDAMNQASELAKIKSLPTLILSSPIDPIATASTHGAFCKQLGVCTLVEFPSSFQTGPVYFHELFTETSRASVIAKVRGFLKAQLKL